MSTQQPGLRAALPAYGFAVLATSAATAVCLLLSARLHGPITFMALTVTVLLVLWRGGSGPALVATLCRALLFAYFLAEPRYSFAVRRNHEQIGLFVYVATCLGGIFTFRLLRENALSRGLLVSMGLLVALLLGNAVLGGLHARQLYRDAGLVIETNETVDLVEEVMLTVVDAETGQRGFLITGDERFLQPHHEALSRLGAQLAVLEDRAKDDERLLSQVRDLEGTAALRLALLKEGIDLRRESEAQARSFIANQRGKKEMDATRALVADLVREERALLEVREQRMTDSYHVTVTTGFFAGFLGLGLLGAFAHLLRRHLQALVKTEEERQYAKALQVMDKNKNEFIATLAHELRSPLGAIQNALHVLSIKGGEPAVAGQMQDLIHRQTAQVSRLVEDLLDVSRISQGKIELRKERLDLAAVAKRAVETSSPLVQTAGHELAVSLPPEPIFVDGDLARLAQLLSNLLNNAAKYTPEGGRIGLAVGRQGRQAEVRVTDNGMGIPAEMLPRIFEMFTQVDRHRSRAQGGLGIGLTLVKRLVEMHGGTLEAHSEGAGKGSTFTVRLPLAEEESEPDLPTEPLRGSVSALGGGRVLR